MHEQGGLQDGKMINLIGEKWRKRLQCEDDGEKRTRHKPWWLRQFLIHCKSFDLSLGRALASFTLKKN